MHVNTVTQSLEVQLGLKTYFRQYSFHQLMLEMTENYHPPERVV